ncbi:PKD domain-containing protein [Amycolatopsis cihanbeyliensis]|uniref:Secreted trypsin-like serine protease n=1 Tax=Amycolatopsis cihanbeyliensis TaxID=1128664 RepID=A0A542DND4_AMYCI|nr:PKD domain-containing protein [Amycolatopsis cihanbeyliensis]TQJ04600.1 secreted trypsin-like serine protease [Amycolatopsis cihanbeyliensis]
MRRVRTRRFGGAAGLVVVAGLLAMTPGLAQAAEPTTEPTDPGFQATTPMEAEPQDGPGTQIVGGEKVSVEDYPYAIAMLREGGPRPMGQTCTASVVAPKVIVTAAHCKDGDGAKSMYYGADDLTVGGGTEIEVEHYFQHPNYQSPNGWQTGWDVGIVVTRTEIPVPDGFSYPRVADSGDTALDDPGTDALTLGYGRIRDGENEYGHLKKADLPIVEGQNTCGSFGSFNENYMICAGYADGHDGICQGDSGGPLVVNGVVIGVSSWVQTGCGSYGAWGRLTNEMGDWANEKIEEHSDPTEPGAPSASFTADCSATEPNCSFDASASTDEDGSIASYAWDFGDGRTGDGRTPSHDYAQSGEYTVELTVTDDEGKTDTARETVYAGEPPAGDPPSASFTVQCQWQNCTVDGTRSTDPDGDIASYAWDFGDGRTGSGATASHAYPSRQANYTVQLEVTDRSGNTDTATKQVQCWDLGSQAFCFGQ